MNDYQPRDGDYVFTAPHDSEEHRQEGETRLKANGCKRVEHRVLEDGRLVAHGYLAA